MNARLLAVAVALSLGFCFSARAAAPTADAKAHPLPPAGTAKSTPALEVVYESVVAPAYPKNSPNYRIPSILKASNGDLLAFMERRVWDYGDISNNEMVLRRSTDDGKTWGPDEDLFAEGLYANSDPLPLLDSHGRIWFFFMWDRKEIAMKHSTDKEGATGWSKVRSLHAQIVPQEWNEYKGSTNYKPRNHKDKADLKQNWKKDWYQRYGVGPGVAAVEMKEGPHKGRIVVPARVHVKTEAHPNGAMYTYAFYSDDRGKNWKRGELAIPFGNENQIIELDGGKLLMSSRDSDSKNKPDKYVRRFADSTDGGHTWTNIREVPDLLTPQCHNPIKRYKHGGQDLLLYTGPASRVRDEKHPYGRRNMAMQISKDMGNTWSKPVVFYEPVSSYSEIYVFDDGTVGVIYERGPAETVRYWDELGFVRLKPDFSKFEF